MGQMYNERRGEECRRNIGVLVSQLVGNATDEPSRE
jgi:hypothetical protein